ncbi:phage tail sheath family protein [Novosphingobium lentum]|uniref:phage tail sheath family protein n=1 Tax=Novosphingobium lentum TaxID=145287 RepID=UPI00082B21EF|nr:phage tail sheath subtilisin-like domain-containing protein [Novosphingobium lentum]
MSVTPSYPGLYIQEIPSNSHAIVPAPTSVAAFVGYVHPYKNPGFDANGLTPVVELFSFSDYEKYFGGLFSSGITDAALPRAVYQFFLNGGSTAYVCGLRPGFVDSAATTIRLGGAGGTVVTGNLATTGGGGITFTALEPTDVVAMTVNVINIRNDPATSTRTMFDLVVTYGSRVETYRGLVLPAAVGTTDFAAVNGASTLVRLSPTGANWGAPFPAAVTQPTFALNPLPANPLSTSFIAADFLAAFAENGPLDNIEVFNLLLIPGVADNAVVSAAMAFAERKRAFAIIDPPPQAPAVGIGTPAPIGDWMEGKNGLSIPRSQNAALYFPYLNSTDPVTGKSTPMAPSGFVAGIYARTDASRGVWKAPAGLATTVLNTTGPVASGIMNDPQQGVLNLDSVNCLRSFAGIGTVVWGARTIVANNTAFAQSMYVPVRRMTLFIEQTLLANLKWVVFEPNDEPLWSAIRSSIEGFMLSLFKQGALQGASPSQAFQVKCDASTTTSDDQLKGIVNIVVAFAPLKPAEFVIIQIAQLAGQAAS